MSTSQRTFEQVKSILGKLDRDIDAARQKRLQTRTPAPVAARRRFPQRGRWRHRVLQALDGPRRCGWSTGLSRFREHFCPGLPRRRSPAVPTRSRTLRHAPTGFMMLKNLRKLFGAGETNPQLSAADTHAGGPAGEQLYNQHLVTSSQLGQTLVVTVVEPELNSFKAADVNHEIRRLMAANAQARNLVIDMGNIEYLDSAGLNAFVDLLTVVHRTGGRIAVAAATQQVEVLFKLTRLELVFTIRRTVIEAIDAIERAG